MTRRRSLAFVFATLGAATLLAACGGNDEEAAPAEPAPAEPAPAEPPAETPAEPAAGGTTLQGSVGPGFTISLTQDGSDVTELAAGTYTIEVNDQADVHNFHLVGPGSGRVDGRRRGRREDLRGHPRGGGVHVRLRPSREPDERGVHGLLPRTFAAG